MSSNCYSCNYILFLSLIISFEGSSVIFIVLRNEIVLTFELFVETIVLFLGYRFAYKYFIKIEGLEGITGVEEFLK